MVEQIFIEIKKIEKKADIIIENAKKESEKIVLEAKRKASAFTAEKQEVIDKEKENKINQARIEIKSENKKSIEGIKKNIEEIKKKASKNNNKAVDFVLKKFEGLI